MEAKRGLFLLPAFTRRATGRGRGEREEARREGDRLSLSGVVAVLGAQPRVLPMRISEGRWAGRFDAPGRCGGIGGDP